jgi:putative pyruvate formate lyase activating enzyme
VDYAVDLGITNAFVQEGEAASESFIPDFEHFDLSAFLER